MRLPEINLYIDCSFGISGDMLLGALMPLCPEPSKVKEAMEALNVEEVSGHRNGHDGGGGHHHGHHHRGFLSVSRIIQQSPLENPVKQTATEIYKVLAEAEAKVHGATLETVHFHEVGRTAAIQNMVGVAAAMYQIRPDRLECSVICDGTGQVECSHGLIPVPVPAVAAMMAVSDLKFEQRKGRSEMVTPTGLAALMGTGTKYRDALPDDRQIIRQSMVTGTRSQPGEGLKAMLWTP